MPGAGRTHGPPATKNAGGSHHRQGQNIRHSLRDGFTAYTCAPRSPGLLASVALRNHHPQSLIPASGDQDATISPSVPPRFARVVSASIASCFVTSAAIGQAPLWSKQDAQREPYISEKRKRYILRRRA